MINLFVKIFIGYKNSLDLLDILVYGLLRQLRLMIKNSILKHQYNLKNPSLLKESKGGKPLLL